MPKKIKIAHIVSEVAPFSKTGGLGDVARSLPKALKRLGQEVIVISPLYGKVIDKRAHRLELIASGINLSLNSVDQVKVNYWRGYLMDGLAVYFVDCEKYFSRKQRIYGSDKENARFLVFNVAALRLLSWLDFDPDIIHCHDWQTGLIPYYLKTDFRYSKALKRAKTIYTIHNLIFQLGRNWWEIPTRDKDYGRSRLPHLSDPALENINFAKRAILSADFINTVSEQYREEIMTKRFGQNLHLILQNRSDRLVGIVNGIDYHAYNPSRDPGLAKRYSADNFLLKTDNKIQVQKLFKLPVDQDVPIFCMTSRVSFQKGFSLIIKVFPQLLRLDAQFIIIGSGDKTYLKELLKLAKKFPDRLAVVPSHEANQKYETLVYAGSDFFLLPSNHEPCGINQLIAMRYGCVPIVRAVGGLYDTVDNFSPTTGRGTGFTFKHEDEFDLYSAVVRALENRKNKSIWDKLVKRVMTRAHGWEIPAKKYVTLYKRVMKM